MSKFYRHADGAPVSEAEAMSNGALRPGYGLRTSLHTIDGRKALDGDRFDFRDNDLERLVAERAELIVEARRILGESYQPGDRTASDIKRDVLAKIVGPDTRAMSGDQLHGAYVAAVHLAASGGVVSASDAQPCRARAYADRAAYLANAWKGEGH
jgi:hypothetical protein